MDAIFFNHSNGIVINSFEDIKEKLIIGGGRFSCNQMVELFECLDLTYNKYTRNLWGLTESSVRKIKSCSDEYLLDNGVKWAECKSWENTDVNSMDLAGHLIEIKHNYLRQEKQNQIWVLFD